MPRINVTLTNAEYENLLKVKDWIYRITRMKPSDAKVAHDLMMYGISERLKDV